MENQTHDEIMKLSISIPLDSDGMFGNECPCSGCSPGYFKIRPRTGVSETDELIYCPYCQHDDTSDNFTTEDQFRFADESAEKVIVSEMDKLVADSLGLDKSGKRKYGNEFFSLEVGFDPGPQRFVERPLEQELRRDIICPSCGLEHSVYGLAFYCPDCGSDIFTTHVAEELKTLELILNEVEGRREKLGPRIAAKDIENVLEDVVSIFEASLKALVLRKLRQRGESDEAISKIFNRSIRNGFQNPEKAKRILEELFSANLFRSTSKKEYEMLVEAFEKRHPITHNLGVVDRKYLSRLKSGQLVGEDIRIELSEIEEAMRISLDVITDVHGELANEKDA